MGDSLQELRRKVKDNANKRAKIKDDFFKNIKELLASDSNDLVYLSSLQLKSLDIGERVCIDNGVEFTKIREEEGKMVFHTIMVDGGFFSEHFHDWIEICTVLKGKLIETRKGDRDTMKVYSEGERVIYDKGEKHSMHVKEYTLLEVVFLKDII